MTDLDASSLKFWESFSEFGFWLVIIGVFGESVDLLSKWVVRRRKTPLPEKIEKWLLPVESFFWVILCIGLAMEFRGGHNAKQIADRENARLNGEAGQARKDAAVAMKQAEEIRHVNLDLQVKLLEVERKTGPRTILPDNASIFRELVKNQPKGGLEFIVVTTAGNSESVDFATALSNLLKSAGYDAPIPPFTTVGATARTPSAEVEINILDPKHAPPFVEPLCRSLNAIGIDAKIIYGPSMVGHIEAITIWPKEVKYSVQMRNWFTANPLRGKSKNWDTTPGFRSFTYIPEAAILVVYGGKREDAGGAGDERRS